MLLEIDVASFTRNEDAQDEVPLTHQGKFLGLLDRQAGFTLCTRWDASLDLASQGAPSPTRTDYKGLRLLDFGMAYS